jgi:hypothetical protein
MLPSLAGLATACSCDLDDPESRAAVEFSGDLKSLSISTTLTPCSPTSKSSSSTPVHPSCRPLLSASSTPASIDTDAATNPDYEQNMDLTPVYQQPFCDGEL